MPKLVDHQQRRQEITEALWRVTASQGFEALSLRQVAAEAGMSMGLVQHYFPTKEEMLLYALDSEEERILGRVAARLDKLPDPPPPRAVVQAVLTEMLPSHGRGASRAHVLSAFWGRAPFHQELGDRLRAGLSQLQTFVADEIARAGLNHGRDPSREAATLLAVVDGLATQVVLGHQEPDRAVEALETALEHVFD